MLRGGGGGGGGDTAAAAAQMRLSGNNAAGGLHEADCVCVRVCADRSPKRLGHASFMVYYDARVV